MATDNIGRNGIISLLIGWLGLSEADGSLAAALLGGKGSGYKVGTHKGGVSTLSLANRETGLIIHGENMGDRAVRAVLVTGLVGDPDGNLLVIGDRVLRRDGTQVFGTKTNRVVGPFGPGTKVAGMKVVRFSPNRWTEQDSRMVGTAFPDGRVMAFPMVEIEGTPDEIEADNLEADRIDSEIEAAEKAAETETEVTV